MGDENGELPDEEDEEDDEYQPCLEEEEEEEGEEEEGNECDDQNEKKEENEKEEEDDDDDDDEEEEEEEEEEEIIIKTRKSILDVVEKLKAYMPSPVSDKGYFTRMLKLMRAGDNEKWYPWGMPPVAAVVQAAESLHKESSSDPKLSNFLGEILEPFYEIQQVEAKRQKLN